MVLLSIKLIITKKIKQSWNKDNKYFTALELYYNKHWVFYSPLNSNIWI